MTFDSKIKSYYGIDPNKSLHSGYKNMIKSLLPKASHQKYKLIKGCAEDIITDLDPIYDLICTSPPYFDLEIYTDDDTQSINKYPNFIDWYNNFLFKSIRDSISKLIVNGILAININNTNKHNITDLLEKDMKKITNMQFLGIIYYGNPKCKSTIYQPIFIWQKLN